MIQAHDYQRLAKMMAACRYSFFWALLIMTSMAAILALLPLQIQRILHAAFIEQDELLAQTAMLTVMVLVIIYGVFSYVGQYWMRKADHQFSMQLHGVLFETLLHLPVQHLQSIDRDQVIQAMLSDIRSLSGAGMQVLTVLIRDTFAVLGLVACLVYLNRDIAVLACILLPFVFLMFQVITSPGPREKYLDVRTQRNIHDDAGLADHLRRCLGNIRHIQLFGGQQQECRQLGGMAQSTLNADHQRDNYQAFVALLCQLLIALIAMAMTYLLVQQIIENVFTIDQAGAFIAIILLLALPIQRLAGISRILWSMQRQLEQMVMLFDLSATATKNAIGMTEMRGELILEQVHVQCNDKTVHQPFTIDLAVKAGETVALIGDHEETRLLLIDLLLGFRPPTSGQILLDGHSYAEISDCDLYAQFAVISNTPVMLSDRIAGNIAYGNTECAHEARITKAAQATGVSHFVREMPEGLQTRIDENSISLTRKQWQLIAVARALLKNPPILIIDDLWPQNAQELTDDVFKALVQVMQNRTTILLLPAMPVYREGIDRILQLKTGKIAVPDKD